MTAKSQTKRIRPSKLRARPGAMGQGKFYHIELQPRSGFKTFRTQDVGRKGGIERVAGRRSDGSWATQKWLIEKSLAHVSGNRLVPDSRHARELLRQFRFRPVRVVGDRFKASLRAALRKPSQSTR